MGIENEKRAMTWNIFATLLTMFREDNNTNDLFEHFEIYTPDLGNFLTSPENGNK